MASDMNTAALLLEVQEKLDDLAREEARHVGPGRERFWSIRDALMDRRKELVMQVPYFWLRALIAHPALGLFVTAVDSRVLRKLVDVDVVPMRPPGDFELVFTFASNEWFEDQCLRKRFSHTEREGRVVGVHSIRWKGDDAADVVARKGRGGHCQSGFFRWIATNTQDISNFGDLIKDEVYPHAIELFFGTYSMAL